MVVSFSKVVNGVELDIAKLIKINNSLQIYRSKDKINNALHEHLIHAFDNLDMTYHYTITIIINEADQAA